MRLARPTFLLGLLTILVAVQPSSCNTKAVGIDECRDIEYARCEAGVYCKTAFAIDDVNACKRYYRDQCLHGLDVSKSPGKPEVSQCVESIQQLGRCAKTSGENAPAKACLDDTWTNAKIVTVCQLLKNPQVAPNCSFLVDQSDEGTGGTDSGEGGTAENGGSSGEGGSAGSGGAS
jgi:uncharacterized membrane protein YgcG